MLLSSTLGLCRTARRSSVTCRTQQSVSRRPYVHILGKERFILPARTEIQTRNVCTVAEVFPELPEFNQNSTALLPLIFVGGGNPP